MKITAQNYSTVTDQNQRIFLNYFHKQCKSVLRCGWPINHYALTWSTPQICLSFSCYLLTYLQTGLITTDKRHQS